ncbi:MAG: dienelactone hydrolase family protein [Acidimicrobiales bacterium]
MSGVASPRFPLYVTGDTEAPRAVIVLQEAFGVNHHIRGVADRLGDANFFAVAPHLYHRDGSPEIPYGDLDSAKEAMSHLHAEGLRNDLDATTDFLSSLGYHARSVGAIGFCMGGSVAFFAATLSTVGAAVSFYGGGVTSSRMGLAPLLELAPKLRAPWLGFYGDLDSGIPTEEVERLRVATAQSAVATEIVRYPDAQHGFHCDERPSVFHEAAAHDAYARALAFLDAQLAAK